MLEPEDTPKHGLLRGLAVIHGCGLVCLTYCVAMETELSEPIQLTPMLSLAVALLYMMTADGDIEEHESSQLQAVLGGNDEALELAMEYVETWPLTQFLKESPPQLSEADRLCILCNACDSVMSDGKIESAELAMFQQMSEAFGVSAQAFAPYFKAIEFKNNKSILGPYDPESLNAVIIKPHLAMAAAIIYMMSADGKIAKEEIGQLKLMIGEFEGLQTTAMKYVRNFKMSQFLKESAPYLNDQQKLLILTVIFDAMQSDGQVEDDELDLFKTIQKAFGIKDDAFQSLASAMTTKNIKPFGLDVIDPKTIHKRRAKRKPRSDGGLFSFKKSADQSDPTDQRHLKGSSAGAWQADGSVDAKGNIIQQTLDSNIQDVSESFKNQADIDLISDNAKQKDQQPKLARDASTDNIQNIQSDGAKANIQGIPTDASKANMQGISNEAIKANIQGIPTDASKANMQGIDVKALKSNNQGLPVDRYNDIMAEIDHDSRMESLQAEIKYLHEKLDQVKPTKQFVSLDTLFSRKSQKQEVQVGKDANDENIQLIQANHILDSEAIASNHKSKLGDILHQRIGSLLPLDEHPSKAPTATVQEAADGLPAHDPASMASTVQPNEDGESLNLELPVEEELDGGIRLRSLLLLLAVSCPLVVFAYGWIYPTMVCQGQAHQVQSWSPDGELSEPRVIEDDRQPERHLLQIRRGEVNINNQRFPLFKELNPSNHFAQNTPEGFNGSYTNHVVDRMDYAFSYNKRNSELSIVSKSDGVRYFDGQSGRVEITLNFKGQCENRWF
ncbi:terB_like domain containing protein [Burkholderiaceae bacterium]